MAAMGRLFGENSTSVEDGVSKAYEILAVSEDATLPEIKAAYRAKAKLYHPDHGGDVERFLKLSAAYQVIMEERFSEKVAA